MSQGAQKLVPEKTFNALVEKAGQHALLSKILDSATTATTKIIESINKSPEEFANNIKSTIKLANSLKANAMLIKIDCPEADVYMDCLSDFIKYLNKVMLRPRVLSITALRGYAQNVDIMYVVSGRKMVAKNDDFIQAMAAKATAVNSLLNKQELNINDEEEKQNKVDEGEEVFKDLNL